MRQVGKILVVAFLLATLAPNTAHAEFFKPVEVLRAGAAQGGDVFVRLKDTFSTPRFSESFYRVSRTVSKEILAVALTAISLDLKVQVNLDTTNKILIVMYLLK